jgi:hypothetical protein
MTQTITLTLVKSLIIESVKNETFLTGQVVKAGDERQIATAYHEQAGDETYQERLLNRAFWTNLEELKTFLSDYLSSEGASSGDNISSEEEGDNVIVRLVVGARFNKGYTSSLAKLSAKYIEEAMLVDWWKPVNEKQSALYAQFLERHIQAIRRCFNKKAPSVPSSPYASSITSADERLMLCVGDERVISYGLNRGAVDDIEAKACCPYVCSVERTEDGFTVKGEHAGVSKVRLWSRHDDTIMTDIDIEVYENG